MASKILSILLLCAALAQGVDYTLPAANQGYWSANTTTGVTGGLDQYRAGGAEARGSEGGGVTLNVEASPYKANSANPYTTGTVAAGGSVVTVASPTNFRVGDLVRHNAPWVEQHTLDVTSPASVDGSVVVQLFDGWRWVPILSTDTTAQIATKIRDYDYGSLWTTSGAGNQIIWTSTFMFDTTVALLAGGPAGYSATPSTLPGGTWGKHTITAISGNDITITPARSPLTGATNAVFQSDNARSINLAIDDANPGDLVYIPAGTYRCDEALAIYHDEDGITVRGDGPGVTILDSRASTAFSIGSGDTFSHNVQTVTGTGGSAGSWPKGATVMNVADSTDYTVGYLAKIFIANEEDNTRIQAGAPMAMSITGYENVRTHTVKIVAVAAGAITIDPPLPVDCAHYALQIKMQQNEWHVCEKSAVEDMTISAENATVANGVYFTHCSECWVYNVETIDISNYPSKNYDSYRCENRHNTWGGLGGGGSNGSGILWNTCSSGLLVDNIFQSCFPFTEENFGSYNNVWAYNFGADYSTVMNVNHGPHNLLNLYEGNVVQGYQSDGYFGSASNVTFFRNWLHAQYLGAQRNAVSQNRFTRNFAHVGNVMGWDGVSIPADSYGNPNMGNGSFTGSAQPSLGDFWTDWGMTGTIQASGLTATQALITLSTAGHLYVGQGGTGEFNGPSVYWSSRSTYRRLNQIMSISGVDVVFGLGPYTAGDAAAFPSAGTAVVVFTGSNGFQEQDLDCEATTIRIHNYMGSLTTGSVTDSTADTLPNSMTYSGTPSWWNDNGFAGTYPPINPDAPNWNIEEVIPASARYYAGSVDSTAPSLSSAVIATNGNSITLTHNDTIVVGSGGNSGWVLTLSTGSATATYSSGSGTNSLIYTLSNTVPYDTTGTIAYTQPGDGIEDDAGNDLVTLSGFALTNDSSVGEGVQRGKRKGTIRRGLLMGR